MAAAKVACIGSDNHFGRGYGGQPQRVISGEQEALFTAPRWKIRDYAEWCARWFDQQRFVEMAMDGKHLVVYDQNHRASDTTVGAYVGQWMALGRAYAEKCFGLEHVNMPYVRHSDEVKNGSRLRDWLQKGIDTATLDLACFCLRKPFDSDYLVRKF